MHLIIRHLYDRLIEKDQRLSAKSQVALTLAYQRTSANVVRKLAETGERALSLANLHCTE
jgi:hypothetical protein